MEGYGRKRRYHKKRVMGGNWFSNLNSFLKKHKAVSTGLSWLAPMTGSYAPLVSGLSSVADLFGYGKRRRRVRHHKGYGNGKRKMHHNVFGGLSHRNVIHNVLGLGDGRRKYHHKRPRKMRIIF